MNANHTIDTGAVRATTPEQRAFAEERLHKWITQTVQSAQGVVNRVMSEVPVDQIAPARVLDMEARPDGIWYRAGENERRLHRHAVGQMAGRAGIPLKYVDSLSTPEKDGEIPAWKGDLLAHTLHEHFHHDPKRYLLRSVGNETRGFLSDKYRRIDCRPVLETLIEASNKVGGIVVDGTASEVRSHLKIVIPKIVEPYPGEFVVWGLSWTNSDFGSGANELNLFVGRVWCWNGMVGEKAVRQIHLGRRLGDDIAYSRRTLELDTKLSVSAVKDTVKHYLSEEKMSGFLGAIASAHEATIDGKAAEASLAKRTTKATAKEVVEKFNSADVVDLPAGNSEWRWANAISLVARDSKEADKKIDLERLAGEYLSKHGMHAQA